MTTMAPVADIKLSIDITQEIHADGAGGMAGRALVSRSRQ
jgi:hypothetical protein